MINILITEDQYNRLFETSYGYHSGDLGKSQSDGLYGLNASRHTGHFGSGTYFFGDRDKAEQYSAHDLSKKRPVHQVDFDNYNLFKPKTEEEGEKLHDFFYQLNSEFVRYPKGAPLNDEEYNRRFNYLGQIKQQYARIENVPKGVFNHFIKIAQTLEDYGYWYRNKTDIRNTAIKCLQHGWPRNEIMDEVLDKLKEDNIQHHMHKFMEFINEWKYFISDVFDINEEKAEDLIYACRDYFISHDLKRDTKEYNKQGKPYYKLFSDIDSCSTFFMKQLGYQGIDVRGYNNLDNSMYGSVIYDLKK